ncbi:hypothetical protein [Calycomorphotria hydatis]|uniref:Endonuclease III n=1 Tax=Calycomorphotria hydatis TaxID=2528027 RepID=A0A517TCS6_9PLAN|nr:hypothetical protein [Calycomorphotria hydatis]QDT66183.1 hypothetical protein V22_34480 [Calycomorphotria hydatis]
MKASEKQQLARQLVTVFSKNLPAPPKKFEHSVLETMLFAICLEDTSWKQAEESYDRLHEEFYDLNEIRVSTITELARVFPNPEDAERRAHRVRRVLQYIFEDQYNFDLESIRKKTLEQATKHLKKIRDLSSFIQLFTLQRSIAAHVVPVDDLSVKAAVWCGLVDAKSSQDDAADSLKQAVRKADGPEFTYFLHEFAAAKHEELAADVADNSEDLDPKTAVKRSQDLFSGKRKKAKPKAPAKPSSAKSKKAEPKKAASKKAAKKPAASKKAAPKKSAAKKAPVKAAVKKKAAAKKKTATKKPAKKKK